MGLSGVKSHQLAHSEATSIQIFEGPNQTRCRPLKPSEPGAWQSTNQVWRGGLKSAEQNIQALFGGAQKGRNRRKIGQNALKTTKKPSKVDIYAKNQAIISIIYHFKYN